MQQNEKNVANSKAAARNIATESGYCKIREKKSREKEDKIIADRKKQSVRKGENNGNCNESQLHRCTKGRYTEKFLCQRGKDGVSV